MKIPPQQITLFKIFLLANISILTMGLGEYFDQPTQNEFQLISVSQLNSFTLNYTATIAYNTTKIRQPTPLISYDILLSDHTLTGYSPVYEQWFYIWFANVTKTSIDIFFVTYNEPNNVVGQYFSFKVLISCVDTKYFHIINWEYMGPRLNNTQSFFDITINPAPDPFKYCFSDAASTVREKINFLMTFNGVIAANWAILVRNVNIYSRSTFHITNSNVTYFNVSMLTDHLTWADKFFLGMLFTCPKSYTLKLKYYSEIHFIGVGTPYNCIDQTLNYNSYITLANNYPYLEILVFRAIQPMISVGFTYAANFTLDATVNPLLRYYRAWNVCGFVDYLVMHVVEKYCQGNRTFIESNGSCICNNSLNFYDNGSVVCNFICPTPLVDVDFQCYSCEQLYGLGCVACTNTTCTLCDTNFILSNTNLSCECTNDRFLFNLTSCYLCSNAYDPYCTSCDNISCIACATNFNLINNKCYCTVAKFVFLGMCLLCETYYGAGCMSCDEISCIACDTNWTQNIDGTCACTSPNFIQTGTENCIKVNTTNNNNTNTSTQTFEMTETHIQLGSSLYIFLSFNQPLSEITQIIPLQANTIFTQGQSQITSITWSNNGLNIVVNLDEVQQQTTSNINSTQLTMQIINPKYLRWNQISVQNQLPPIITQPFLSQSTQKMAILNYLCQVIQWLYPLMILSSWGVFNNGFQLWFLLTYYLYLKPNIYGNTESILEHINNIQFLPFLNNIVTIIDITYDNINLTQIATSKNTSIIQMTLPVIALYLTSILMCLALRYYVGNKRNNHIYTVYYNFMRYYKEYVYTNFMAIYAFIVFPICVQFQALFKSGWGLEREEVFVNLIVSGVIVIVMVITPFLIVCIFPTMNKQPISVISAQQSSSHFNQQQQLHQLQQQRTYSVTYNKLQPAGMSVLIENYLRVFRALIFVLVIFLLRDQFVMIAELVLIGYNVGYLMVVGANYKKYLSKLYWMLCIIKNVVFVGLQVGFLFLPIDYESLTQQSTSTIIVDSVCSWVIIALIAFEIIELFVKVIRMFVANKYDWNEFQVPNKKILPVTQMGDVLVNEDVNFELQQQQLEINMSITTTKR